CHGPYIPVVPYSVIWRTRSGSSVSSSERQSRGGNPTFRRSIDAARIAKLRRSRALTMARLSAPWSSLNRNSISNCGAAGPPSRSSRAASQEFWMTSRARSVAAALGAPAAKTPGAFGSSWRKIFARSPDIPGRRASVFSHDHVYCTVYTPPEKYMGVVVPRGDTRPDRRLIGLVFGPPTILQRG